MNVRKKIITTLFAFVMLSAVFLFAGCDNTKSCEALIYNSNRFGVNDDFLNENRTYGAYYLDENSELKQDTISPKTRTFVISNEKDHENILSGGVDEVDFDKEVLILYLFTDTHHKEIPYWLTDVSVKGKVLRIGITLHPVPLKEEYIVPAYQRSIIVRMEKVAFKTVEFYEVTENANLKNAVLYDDDARRELFCGMESYFRKNFLDENKTSGAYYYDEDNRRYLDTTSPSTRTLIVTNQEEYDKIFTSFCEVDFEKETLVVYVFTDSSRRNYRISDIILDNNKLTISYIEQQFPHLDDGYMFYQRCFVLKMDKIEFESIEFKQVLEFYTLAYN